MKIITNSYRLLFAGALALMMATAVAPQAQASTSAQPVVCTEQVRPVNGKDGNETHGRKKDGTETHGSRTVPVSAKDGCETHD
jgi:hypothetical protein